MSHIDGRTVTSKLELTADLVIVGSGPAGCSVAREAASTGARVIVVEAGPWVQPSDYSLSAFGSMSSLYRDMGAAVVLGAAPIPYLQGRMVGGSSPINGAICWRMPRDVYDSWCAADPILAEALPWETLESLTDDLETRLGVAPTDPRIAGRKNYLMAQGAEALGLAHRPIRRNVRDCEGLGRCMQGCPRGHKQSVDATLLADALSGDTTVLSSVEVRQISCRSRRAEGVVGLAEGGGTVRLQARHAVVVAASAIQTPALLIRSGLSHGPVGENLQCHPGVSMAGRFHDPVRMWEGATQGHEVTGLRHEGLKFEALGFDLTVLAARLEGVGSEFSRSITDMAHWLDWGAAVRATARGRVRVALGRTVVTFSPTASDVQLFRRSLRVLGDMMFAAGAEVVAPGVRGFTPRLQRPTELEELEVNGPQRASAYTAAITHMFGTCRMGSDPATNVVRPDFRHHAVESLYLADSSVFPTNLGVNPQTPIMAMATLCARRAMEDGSERRSSATGKGSTMPPSRHLTLDELQAMNRHQLHAIMERAYPLDLDALAEKQYQGIDLSLPPFVNRLLWKTFRKTFHSDPESGALRGWNVRMEQTGIDGPQVPMKNREGKPRSFAHYEVRSAEGLRFPRAWKGAHYLDYGVVGNPFGENLAYAPLVAVNEGSMDLLLGWEIFKVGSLMIPLPDYWALRLERPLEEVVPLPGS